jgi:hypothetical protein
MAKSRCRSRSRSRKLSAYNKLVKQVLLKGGTMKEAAAIWKGKKSGVSKSRKRSRRYGH